MNRKKGTEKGLISCHVKANETETSFTPHFDKWGGEPCQGLQLLVTNPESYKPYYTTLAMIQEVMGAWPDQFSWLPPPYEYEFEKLPFDIITGDEAIRKGLEAGRDLDDLEAGWQAELEGFLAQRRQYLLY